MGGGVNIPAGGDLSHKWLTSMGQYTEEVGGGGGGAIQGKNRWNSFWCLIPFKTCAVFKQDVFSIHSVDAAATND